MTHDSTAGQSRRVDNAPETAVDKRFFDLRESGYTGAFDWDTGQPCTDPETLSIFDALDRATQRAAAEVAADEF